MSSCPLTVIIFITTLQIILCAPKFLLQNTSPSQFQSKKDFVVYLKHISDLFRREHRKNPAMKNVIYPIFNHAYTHNAGLFRIPTLILPT